MQRTDVNSNDDSLAAPLTVHHFWRNVIGPRVLQPAVNLTSLAMGSTICFGALICLDWDSITFPFLASLSLSNFIWEYSRPDRVDPSEVTLQAEDFIVRHERTLNQLELYSCVISIPTNRPTAVRPWTAVWNRFSKELTELVDLDVHYDFHLRYVQHEDGYRFSSAYAVPGTEQDLPALEAFHTIVTTRRVLTYSTSDGDSGV